MNLQSKFERSKDIAIWYFFFLYLRCKLLKSLSFNGVKYKGSHEFNIFLTKTP